MRKILFSFVIVIILIMTSQALAGFKVNVPEGWTREDSGHTMVIKSQGSNASVAVAFNSLGGSDFTDIAERLYVQMKGKDLEQDDDGDYSFSFVNNSGAAGFVMITGDKDNYLVISATGFQDDEKLQDDISKILDSLDYEDD